MINKISVKKGSILVAEIQNEFDVDPDIVDGFKEIINSKIKDSNVDIKPMVLPENVKLTIIEEG